MTDDRDQPVARPTLDGGALYVYSDEDIGELAAEMFSWVRECPEIDEARAEEISTMMYEILTGEWAQTLHDE